MYQSAMRWLAVWLDMLVVLVTFCTSLLIVLLSDRVEPAYAGMAVAFAIQVITRISHCSATLGEHRCFCR